MNIYLSNETNFERNGVGFLNDLISAKVTESLNGDYILEIQYPINGYLSEYLVEDNIIKSNVGNDNYQLFRIKKVTKDFSIINIYALHISYDLLDNMLLNVAPTNQNCASFGQWILDNSATKNNFTFESDITNTASARYVRKNPIEAIMGNDNNSMINLFNGELERDNFKIKMLSSRGNNNNVKLMFGKNITEIKMTIDITSLFTRIIPIGYDGLMLPEIYVDSPLINDYFTPKISKAEFSNIKYDPNDTEAYQTEEEAYEALRNATRELYNQGIDKPNINIKINWVELSKTKQYYQMYSNLEKVSLGDVITANILGLDYTTKVTKTIYNVLTDSIDKFEIGTLQKTIGNTINNNQTKVENINVNSILENANKNASNLITSAMGGYVYKTNNELYIMDTDNIKTAQKVWRWNINGLGYSNNGVDGPYEIAMTMDGSINANLITTGKINTSLIEGYEALVLQVNKIEDIEQNIIVDKRAFGNPITIEDAGPYPLESIEIEGKSVQDGTPTPDAPVEIKSIEGVTNLFEPFEEETKYGISLTKNDDGSINLKGTSTYNSELLFVYYKDLSESGFEEGKTYTLSLNQNMPSGNVRLEIYQDSKWLSLFLSSSIRKTNTSDFTNANRMRFGIFVPAGATIDIRNLTIQVEEGTIAHPYVPYGRWLEQKTIGRNKFNKEDTLSAIGGTSGYVSSNYIPVKNGDTIYKNNSVMFWFYNSLKESIGSATGSTSTIISLENVAYVRCNVLETDLDTFMLTINEELPTSYKPYKENTALIDMNKKNLFDKDNANVLKAYLNNGVLIADENTYLVYVPCKPNTNYAIKKVSSSRFIVYGSTDEPVIGGSGVNYGYVFTDGIIVNTNATTNYLMVVYYKPSEDTLTEEEIRKSIKIYESIETGDYYRLASIGDIKDTFKDGVLSKKIGKYILDANEYWSLYNGCWWCDVDIPYKKQQGITTMCTHYQSTNNGQGGGDAYNNGNNTICLYYPDNLNRIYFRDDSITTEEQLEEFLTNNIVELYYILAEPIEHTLPYEVLELHEGYNYITTNDNLEPNMNITYLTDSKLNAQFATKAEVKIETDSIKQSVSAEIDELDKKTEASLELKVNKKNLASEINAIADFIKLVSNELVIETDKFKLAQGVMEAVGGKIANFEITENALSFSIVPKMDYTQEDVDKVSKYLIHEITLTDEELELYDVDNDGKILSRDGLLMSYFIKFGITTSTPGKFQITVPGENDAFTSTKIGFFDGAGNLINGFSYNSATFEKLSVASGSVYGEHLLYNDEDGTTSNVDLLDDLETYKYFEVLYELNGGLLKSTGKLPVKIGAFFVLDGVWNTDVGLTLQIQTRKYLINNWQLLTAGDEFWRNMNQPDSSSFAINVDGNSGDQLTIKIHTVLGYK